MDKYCKPVQASMVLGTPGSGKSYAIVNNYIKQQIEKGFAVYIYDYKFPDLSEIAYNHLISHLDGYKVKPKFYMINFDDPRKSHRCNPINPVFMTDISTDTAADEQLSPLYSFLHLLGMRVIEQENIPLLRTRRCQPMIAEKRTKRQTQPVAPLVDQNPFSLIKRIFHPGRRNYTSRHKQGPHQPYGQHRQAGRSQPPPSGLSFVHRLFNGIHKLKQTVPANPSVKPATILVQRQPDKNRFTHNVVFRHEPQKRESAEL